MMKIIDLLNKIANNEEVPKRIKYGNDIYVHIDNYCYYCDETNLILSDRIFAEHDRLNDKVEIIEEPKKIEYITSFYDGMSPMEKELKDKVNELIDEVNKCTK